MSKYAVVFIALLLTTQVFGAMVGFDADDFADYENMHTPVPEMTLWRSYHMQNPDKRYDYKVFAVPSTDNLLGERSIGWLLSPAEGYHEWWADEPCLYIEINGLASSIRIKTANRPNWIRKNVVVQCWDIDGTQVANNFDNIGGWLTTNVGEYTISSVAIWTSGQMAIDDIEINHIPEPTTLLFLGLGMVLLGRKRLRNGLIKNIRNAEQVMLFDMPVDFFGGSGVGVAGDAGDDVEWNILKHLSNSVVSYGVRPEFRDAGFDGKSPAKCIQGISC